MSADGIDFDDCYLRKKIITAEGIEINIISKDDLIKNKKASKRLIDLADAENLKH